ncbi:hypothetical protein B0J11DRAFT_516470 [Dendryphion nanum]|uniref:Guanine nucleotide-exchange factor SEC12 n=1 Tax=Dendryphion nanum TaxID=256645 RepID=A0A9P9EJC7_9PLEO|nr:hypothetical protein B0J11DRAFT_516470 [Dendryphion nanum]
MSQTTVSKAETKYPIFAATFAYNNPAILAVAGGGGAGRSGVPNAISVFDTSSRSPNLEPIAEIDLSRDEDSITCLANLATKNGVILYAGINSTEAERLKGKNEHFRSFEVTYPSKSAGSSVGEKTGDGKLQFLSKTAVLKSPSNEVAKKEAYQRLIRLSPPKPGKAGAKRIGVIASSLAGDENEVVVFPATSTKPAASEIIQRIPLAKGQEANDIDIREVDDGHFHVLYATDYSVYLSSIENQQKSVRKVYEIPHSDLSEKKGRSKVRGLRILSPSHILLLVNLHNRTGVELLVLRLYEEGMGSIIMRKRLPRHIKAAVDMDVALLDSDKKDAYQAVVAVGGHDCSLSIFTIDYNGSSRNSLGKFISFATYRDVHPFQMTKVVFSPFFAPITSSTGKAKPQYLRVASTSLGNSVSVETFELKTTSSNAGTRHILQSASSARIYTVITTVATAFIVLMFALMVQSLIDPEGNLTKNIIPASFRNSASGLQPPGVVFDAAHSASAKIEAAADGVKVPVVKTSNRIRDLLHLHHPSKGADAQRKALVIHDDPDTKSTLSTELHADTEEVVKRHTEAKTWDELSHAEQKKWKNKLVDAGVWAVEEGETILKGIFFSEMGGIVRHVAEAALA